METREGSAETIGSKQIPQMGAEDASAGGGKEATSGADSTGETAGNDCDAAETITVDCAAGKFCFCSSSYMLCITRSTHVLIGFSVKDAASGEWRCKTRSMCCAGNWRARRRARRSASAACEEEAAGGRGAGSGAGAAGCSMRGGSGKLHCTSSATNEVENERAAECKAPAGVT